MKIEKITIMKIAIILFFILLGIIARATPHPWNFTPISAIALLLSAYFGWRTSLIAILSIMLASDLLLGFYHLEMMLAVYGSFILAVGLGTLIQRKKIQTILFASLGSSLLFFFITNWAVWQFGTMYNHTISGLWESYFMALPFFRHTLAGDLIYTGVFFAIFETCLYLKPKIIKIFTAYEYLGSRRR